jgi:hypothetical protein
MGERTDLAGHGITQHMIIDHLPEIVRGNVMSDLVFENCFYYRIACHIQRNSCAVIGHYMIAVDSLGIVKKRDAQIGMS